MIEEFADGSRRVTMNGVEQPNHIEGGGTMGYITDTPPRSQASYSPYGFSQQQQQSDIYDGSFQSQQQYSTYARSQQNRGYFNQGEPSPFDTHPISEVPASASRKRKSGESLRGADAGDAHEQHHQGHLKGVAHKLKDWSDRVFHPHHNSKHHPDIATDSASVPPPPHPDEHGHQRDRRGTKFGRPTSGSTSPTRAL